jgi:hypothetical protein
MLDKTKTEKTLNAIKNYFKQMGGQVKLLEWGTSTSIVCSAPMPDLKDRETECICKLTLDLKEGFNQLNLADNWYVSKEDGEFVITSASPDGDKCIFWNNLRTYTGEILEDTDLILQKIQDAVTLRKSLITESKKLQIEKDFEDGNS